MSTIKMEYRAETDWTPCSSKDDVLAYLDRARKWVEQHVLEEGAVTVVSIHVSVALPVHSDR